MRTGGRFWVTGLCFALVAGVPAVSSIQAFHRSYGPKTALFVSSPTLQWEVWPSDGAHVTSATMRINGEDVKATYNEKARRLEYQPTRPFQPGSYRVQCRVLVEERLEVKKDWTFQVSANAIDSLPQPSPSQELALLETNLYRRKLGLDEAFQEPRLNAASLAHVKYLTQNRRTGHYEKQGEPGFVGVTPSERLEAFGYCGGSWECVTYNSGGIKESVRDLFHAPYHRIPFLQPGRAPIGTGVAGKNFSIKFGDSGESGLTVSPAPNQKDIPVSWDGNETPNPLRMHDAGMVVGYPIVVSFFASDTPTLRLKQAMLTTAGRDVPFFVNSVDNDDNLQNSIFLIPKRPLQPNTTYQVSIEAAVGKKTVERTWMFTTGDK